MPALPICRLIKTYKNLKCYGMDKLKGPSSLQPFLNHMSEKNSGIRLDTCIERPRFYPVLATCKFDEDWILYEGAILLTFFSGA